MKTQTVMVLKQKKGGETYRITIPREWVASVKGDGRESNVYKLIKGMLILPGDAVVGQVVIDEINNALTLAFPGVIDTTTPDNDTQAQPTTLLKIDENDPTDLEEAEVPNV